MKSLVIEAIVKRYGPMTALELGRGVPLALEPGQLGTVVGAPGSGKTVLARLVAGLERSEEGRIVLGDRDLTSLAPEARKVAVIFEDDVLWSHWNVAQNIEFPLRCRGVGRATRRHRLSEVMALADVDGLQTQFPRDLRPVDRMRVALARALALDPDLLVIDEPFDRFDAQERESLTLQIRQIHAEQKLTTLAFTRHAPEALGLADRIALLDAGRFVQVGRPTEVYLRPESLAVAQVFGPVNVVAAVVDSVDARGQCVLRTPLGRLIARPGAQRPAPGSSVQLLFRPEALQIGPAGFGTNRFASTLVRRVPQALLWRLDLEGPGDWRGWALALPSQAGSIKEGQSITVSVAPESLVIDVASAFGVDERV